MLFPAGDPIALGYVLYFLLLAEAVVPQFHYSFTVSNQDNTPAIVKKITIDDVVYLDHEITLGPRLRSAADNDSSFSFNVFRFQVSTFEMVVEDSGDDFVHKCDLASRQTRGKVFLINFTRYKPCMYPMESLTSLFEYRPSLHHQ